MIKKDSRHDLKDRRHARARKKLNGTAQRPRLAVFRSEKHIYVQLIDDMNAVTVASASSLIKDLKSTAPKAPKEPAAPKTEKKSRDAAVPRTRMGCAPPTTEAIWLEYCARPWKSWLCAAMSWKFGSEKFISPPAAFVPQTRTTCSGFG